MIESGYNEELALPVTTQEKSIEEVASIEIRDWSDRVGKDELRRIKEERKNLTFGSHTRYLYT